VANHGKPGRIWQQSHSYERTGMQVIERGPKEDDRAGVPFGFSRALLEGVAAERAELRQGSLYFPAFCTTAWTLL
jgi:hypothetical protein